MPYELMTWNDTIFYAVNSFFVSYNNLKGIVWSGGGDGDGDVVGVGAWGCKSIKTDFGNPFAKKSTLKGKTFTKTETYSHWINKICLVSPYSFYLSIYRCSVYFSHKQTGNCHLSPLPKVLE